MSSSVKCLRHVISGPSLLRVERGIKSCRLHFPHSRLRDGLVTRKYILRDIRLLYLTEIASSTPRNSRRIVFQLGHKHGKLPLGELLTAVFCGG